MSLNQAMIRVRNLQEQMQKVSAIKEGLLTLYSALGTVYANVDATEAARLPHGISQEGFQALRESVDQALQKLDAAIAVAAAQHRGIEKKASDAADDFNAVQMGMKRAAGLAGLGRNSGSDDHNGN